MKKPQTITAYALLLLSVIVVISFVVSIAIYTSVDKYTAQNSGLIDQFSSYVSGLKIAHGYIPEFIESENNDTQQLEKISIRLNKVIEEVFFDAANSLPLTSAGPKSEEQSPLDYIYSPNLEDELQELNVIENVLSIEKLRILRTNPSLSRENLIAKVESMELAIKEIQETLKIARHAPATESGGFLASWNDLGSDNIVRLFAIVVSTFTLTVATLILFFALIVYFSTSSKEKAEMSATIVKTTLGFIVASGAGVLATLTF